ncbi:hypothetical protein MNV49_006136 [Pseudohyphozyma bogoriensis]|nr:hypothetical protein MNV49_006136 [Pseudohyphozyma bogoriensis]
MIIRPLALVALAAPPALAFYVPGIAPKDFLPGDRVPLLVNSLTPQVVPGSSELKSLIHYNYYDDGFGFCKPTTPPKKQSESLGSVLFGDRLFDSPFELNMMENVTCRHLCTSSLDPSQSDFLSSRVRDSYAVNWLVDGLPAAEMKRDEKTGEVFYSVGFALGNAGPIMPQVPNDLEVKDWRIEVNNHYDIYLEYHSRDGVHRRVVGVVVWPRSVDSLEAGGSPRCDAKESYVVRPGQPNKIAYTYSVYWRESPTPWATRWDQYLRVFDPRIHVLSLINSIVVALFLCGLVAMILFRTVHRDISRYNATDLEEDIQEDFGWKLVHGEVFRPPKKRGFLAIAVGSGTQLASMSGVTLVFALFGFLSPSNRGSLSTVMLVTWTLFGCVSGYVSSRLYASLRGEEWRKNIFMTATLFPGLLFVILFLLNFFLIGSGSSGAIPFGTFLAILALWFLINFPLTVAGAWMGVKKGPVSHPVRVNQIPRQIPPIEWWLKPWPSAAIAGVLPFGAGFIESYFILQSLFGAKAYYAFGFLALTFAVVALTTATTTILMCYFHLSAEEYRWQWRAFLAGGGGAFWLFGYGLLYWATRLHLDGLANKVLYLGYLFLISLLTFMITGAIGFLSCYWFLRVIYHLQFIMQIPPAPAPAPHQHAPQLYPSTSPQPQVQASGPPSAAIAPVQQFQTQLLAGAPASAIAVPQAAATTTTGGGSMQKHLSSVQAQLNKHGGKYGAFVSTQLQVQADALKTVPIVGDVNSRGQAVAFNVHKAGGVFSKDDVVTAASDRNTALYYLDFPHTWRSSWNLTLHRGAKEGPVLCTLNKGSYGFTRDDIEIAFPNGWKTVLAKKSLVSKAHEFVGVDNVTTFKWKSDGMLSSSLNCIDNSTGFIAATWTKSYGFGKDGSLLVSPTYNHMLDVIVATALAMEEWQREEAEKGGGSSSKMNLAKGGMAAFNKLTKK